MDSISFDVVRGEVLGILGESGCGKTTTGLAICGMLPRTGRVVDGSVQLHGRELVGLEERAWQRLRGAEISMVFQEPSQALSPYLRVGHQIEEVIRAHRPGNRHQRRAAVARILSHVGLSDTDRIATSFPHELSGGQRQRIVMAQALVCEPALVIADEPTASLDSVTRREVLDLLAGFKQQPRAFLLTSHDPFVLLRLADRLAVMYAGLIVEVGPCREVLELPLHPYSLALLRSAPGLPGQGKVAKRLLAIPGCQPDPTDMLPGCRFAPRCAKRLTICDSRTPSLTTGRASRTVACFNPE